MHAEHAVKNGLTKSNFFKKVENAKKVKIKKNLFGNLETGWKKKTREIFIFDLALKENFLVHAQHALKGQ